MSLKLAVPEIHLFLLGFVKISKPEGASENIQWTDPQPERWKELGDTWNPPYYLFNFLSNFGDLLRSSRTQLYFPFLPYFHPPFYSGVANSLIATKHVMVPSPFNAFFSFPRKPSRSALHPALFHHLSNLWFKNLYHIPTAKSTGIRIEIRNSNLSFPLRVYSVFTK